MKSKRLVELRSRGRDRDAAGGDGEGEPRGSRGAGEHHEEGPGAAGASDQERQQMDMMLGLLGTMIARLPIAIFKLEPQLSHREEAAMVAAVVELGRHYLPKWVKQNGPWVLFAGTASAVYMPRVMMKIQAEAVRRQKEEERKRAGTFTAQPTPPPAEDAADSEERVGEDLFGEAPHGE